MGFVGAQKSCPVRSLLKQMRRRLKYPNVSDARCLSYEGWNFNSGNYLFTTDTK